MQLAWVQKHAPFVLNLDAGPLVLAADTIHATRTIQARVLSALDSQTEFTSSTDVHYDLPPPAGESASEAAKRADRHRRREERAILAFDAVGLAEHRAAKTALQRSARHELAEVRRTVIASLTPNKSENELSNWFWLIQLCIQFIRTLAGAPRPDCPAHQLNDTTHIAVVTMGL